MGSTASLSMRSSKWRWDVVAFPVLPTVPTGAPAGTTSADFTRIVSKCPYNVVMLSPWSRITALPYPRIPFPTYDTIPRSEAPTGVPRGARMSIPSWRPKDLYPKPEETGPETGDRNFFSEILSSGVFTGTEEQPANSAAVSSTANLTGHFFTRGIRAGR